MVFHPLSRFFVVIISRFYIISPFCFCDITPLRPIPAGAKENIHIKFTPAGSGHFNKVLSIFANNSGGPIIIHITGIAKPDIHRVINSKIDSVNFKN